MDIVPFQPLKLSSSDDIRAPLKPPSSSSWMIAVPELAAPGWVGVIGKDTTAVFSVAKQGYLRLCRAKSADLRNCENDASIDDFGFVFVDERWARFG